MLSLLLIGFLIGMRHALEADHVAAVASLISRRCNMNNTLKQGAVWGLGHTITLLLFGSVAILIDSAISEQLAATLEFAVGLMLILLGFDVLRRLYKERVHFHLHRHGQKTHHFHAHSHAADKEHANSEHQHSHGFPKRALLIGLMHGMAGSAALIILTLHTVQSPITGLLYILFFGIGSIIGMAVLSVIIAIPLRYSSNGLTWLYNGLQAIVGVATLSLGSITAINYLT
jgi:ABC-type nickel/cobalt efflux system permease component RcnA